MQTELEFIQQFEDLRTTGTYETFKEREDGSPYKHSSFSYVNGKLQGLKERFYSNGLLMSRHIVLPNGVTQSLLEYPDENDPEHYIIRTHPNEDGCGTFEQRVFVDGQLHSITPYVDGKRHGTETIYCRQPQLTNLFEQNRAIACFETQPVQLDQVDLCAICFATPDEMVEPITLACHVKHTFCLGCIKPILNKLDRKCCTCRQPILPQNTQSFLAFM